MAIDYGSFKWPSVGGTGVTTINGLSGAVTLAAGTGISITPSGNTLTIASTSAGDVTLAAFGSSPNANAASISGSQVLNLQPASASFPGGVSTTTQTFAGDKTFNGIITAQGSGASKVVINGNAGIGGGIALYSAAGRSFLTETDGASQILLDNVAGVISIAKSGNFVFNDSSQVAMLTLDETAGFTATKTLTVLQLIDSGLTANTAVIANGSKQLASSTTTSTELGYVNGVTSAIQTQLNSKQASGNYITALTGDVTASGPGSVASTIANNVVTNAKLAQMATLTIKGNNTGGTANALDLTVAQVNAILPVFTSTLNGLAPLSGGGSTNFLRADGTWAAPTGTNTGTVTSVAMTVPTFLSISGSPITTSGTLAVTLSGTALPLANGGTGQTTKAAAFDALQPMTTGGDIIYGGASGTGTRLANGSAGQYLKSSGGTSAPTWSTFAVPTVQKFTSSSGTYTTPAGVLYLRVRMIGGGGGGASTTGTTGGQNGTASTFGTSLLTANPGGGTSSTVGGAGGSNSGAISAPAYGTAISGATGNYGANLASTSGGSGASSALGGAGFGGNINASGGAAVANTGSGGGGGGGTIGGGSEGGGGAGVYIDAIVPSPSATYSYTVGAGGAGGTGGDVGGNGGSGYIEVTEYYS